MIDNIHPKLWMGVDIGRTFLEDNLIFNTCTYDFALISKFMFRH